MHFPNHLPIYLFLKRYFVLFRAWVIHLCAVKKIISLKFSHCDNSKGEICKWFTGPFKLIYLWLHGVLAKFLSHAEWAKLLREKGKTSHFPQLACFHKTRWQMHGKICKNMKSSLNHEKKSLASFNEKIVSASVIYFLKENLVSNTTINISLFYFSELKVVSRAQCTLRNWDDGGYIIDGEDTLFGIHYTRDSTPFYLFCQRARLCLS